MDNSIYIALSKQTALFRQMDVIANNVANADTAGFKSDAMLFKNYLVKNGNNQLNFTKDTATVTNNMDGALQNTGKPLNVAIQGPGYFTVQTPLGDRYTRAGNFQLDANGTLVTAQGYPVLSADKQPTVLDPTKDVHITITDNGAIMSDAQQIGTVGVVTFPNEQLLKKTGNTLYSATETPAPAENPKLVQGALESSNVVPIKEITNMIEISRAVTDTNTLINDASSLERNAVQTLAKQD
jgi:flagellar basal-body rod protein FlgF